MNTDLQFTEVSEEARKGEFFEWPKPKDGDYEGTILSASIQKKEKKTSLQVVFQLKELDNKVYAWFSMKSTNPKADEMGSIKFKELKEAVQAKIGTSGDLIGKRCRIRLATKGQYQNVVKFFPLQSHAEAAYEKQVAAVPANTNFDDDDLPF